MTHDRRPTAAERLAAVEAEIKRQAKVLIAIQAETAEISKLSAALTQPTTPGGKSVIDIMKEAAVADMSMGYIAARIKAWLIWMGLISGALGSIVATKMLGLWGQ